MSLLRNPIFCALDTPDLNRAQKLTESIRGHVHGFKVGLEFFLAHGEAGCKKISHFGTPIFLDLKLHDIPNTVAAAVNSLLPVRPHFMTVHASGGAAMMQAAADAAGVAGSERPKLLGVTVLTSLDGADLEAVGQDKNVLPQTVRLAKLAQANGLDGAVCSSQEIKAVREACGPDFIIMVPGIRPAWTKVDDQKRVMTPVEAKAAGANFIVIGRPITESENPAETARRIASEVS
jgi:orotidine-5'-phosphate decarboxylase